MTYPKWFEYEIASFKVHNILEINQALMKNGVDAREIINIEFVSYISGGPYYIVFYRKNVAEREHARFTPNYIRDEFDLVMGLNEAEDKDGLI